MQLEFPFVYQIDKKYQINLYPSNGRNSEILVEKIRTELSEREKERNRRKNRRIDVLLGNFVYLTKRQF